MSHVFDIKNPLPFNKHNMFLATNLHMLTWCKVYFETNCGVVMFLLTCNQCQNRN